MYSGRKVRTYCKSNWNIRCQIRRLLISQLFPCRQKNLSSIHSFSRPKNRILYWKVLHIRGITYTLYISIIYWGGDRGYWCYWSQPFHPRSLAASHWLVPCTNSSNYCLSPSLYPHTHMYTHTYVCIFNI